jgi:hypothetical protein
VENEAQHLAQTALGLLPDFLGAYRNDLIMLAGSVGIIGGLFGIFGYVSHTRRATVRAVRDDLLRLPAERKRLAAELRGNTWADRYERRLQGGLDWLERTYAGKGSRHALLLSILLALVYAWMLFCLAWGFGLSDGSLLGQEILPPTEARWRWPAGPGLGLLPLVLFYGIRWLSPRIGLWQQERERRIREVRPVLVWPFRLAFAAGLGLMVLATMALSDWATDGVIDKPVELYAVAVAFAVAFAFAFAFAVAGAGTVLKDEWKRPLSIPQMAAILAAIGLFGIVLGVISDRPDQAIVFGSFQLVLPLINGLADWASLWVSRHLAGKLLEQIHERDGKRLALLIAWDLVRDLAAALFFLAGLAFVLAFLMQAISQVRGFGYDVTAEIARAAADPLGEGLWLALILFSTLIPTVVHASLLLVRPLSLYGPPRAEREAWAETLESRHFRTNNAACQDIAHQAAKWSIERNDLWAILIRYGFVILCYAFAAWGTWQLWRLIFGPGFGPADAIAAVAEFGVWAVPF